MYYRDRLIDQIKQDAVEYGDFTLASGAKSKYYIDLRKVTFSADGLHNITAGIFDLWRRGIIPDFDSVGGLAIGADPIVVSVLLGFGISGRGFTVRKESKDHGTGKLIEGSVLPGDWCLIVEDVATSGGSIMKAVDAVVKFGCTIVGVVVVLDRKQGAAELLASHGLKLVSLLTIDDLELEKP